MIDHRTSARVIGAVAWLALGGTPLSAQNATVCRDDSTISECFTSGVPELAAMRVELNDKPTGSAEPAGANPTAISDYLPRLATALVAPGISEDLPALSFSGNLPLNDGVLFNWGVTVQAALTLKSPEVFPALLDSVSEAHKTAVRTRLEDTFNEFSDPQISVSVNLENGTFGRSPSHHSDDLSRILNDIYASASSSLGPEQAAAVAQLHTLVQNFGTFIRADQATNPQCQGANAGKIALMCFEPDYRRQVEQQIGVAAAAFRAQHLELRRRIEEAGGSRIADLVNNQPQVNTAFEWHPRDPGVGPNEFTLRLRGEWSPASLNAARRACGGALKAVCLSNYLGDTRVRRSLRRGDRLWFTFDVARQESYRAPLEADDSASLRLAAFWRIQPAVGFGWYVSAPESGTQKARLDLQVSGSFQETDEVHSPARILASATYSLRMGENVVGSAGLQWANKPEFLGDDVTRIGARFGVRYKLPPTR